MKQEVDTETQETQRPAHGEQTQEEEPEYKQDQINAKENELMSMLHPGNDNMQKNLGP